jgi:nucleoside-diphosphate-sugar epimerase
MLAQRMPETTTSQRLALVTGVAGFIGHHLAEALLKAGWKVRGVDDLSRGRRHWIEQLGQSIDFHETSVCDPAAMQRAVEGVDVIFHEAAWAGVPQSLNQPLEYHQNNATGTLILLEAARQARTPRFIYAASSSAYGNPPSLPVREDMTPQPISPYAAAKYAGELYVAMCATLHGMQTIRLRYFNVFGPGQDPRSQYAAAIPKIVTRLLRNERPIIYGDGEQTRDFCFIENVIRANLLAADAPKISGEVINIACGNSISLNKIVNLANQLLGTNLAPEYQPARVSDVRHSWADVSLAEKIIGYRPIVQFEEGLRRSIDWYRGNPA